MTQTRILILGGTGFVGSAAVRQLVADGFDVHLLGRSGPDDRSVAFHEADLLTHPDFPALLRDISPSHLLHFAWVTEPRAYWTSPLNLDWIAASLKVATAFAAAGGRRMVVAGTCAEYDWSHHTLDERLTPLNPATPYGQAKVSLYRALEAFAPHLGVSFAWGRIFFPFGPGEKPGKLLTETISSLLAGKSVDLTDGAQTWDLMHVDDVAAAFNALLLSDVEGPVNVASGVTRTVRSIVEAFADRLDGRALLNFGARPRGGAESPYMAAAVARLQSEVGFRPRLTWDESVDCTVAWWREGAGRARPRPRA